MKIRALCWWTRGLRFYEFKFLLENKKSKKSIEVNLKALHIEKAKTELKKSYPGFKLIKVISQNIMK